MKLDNSVSSDEMPQPLSGSTVNRRHFLAGMAGAALLTTVDRSKALAAVVGDVTVNLAKVAAPSASYISGDTKLSALNDGFNPANSHDQSHGSYGNWPRTDPQWVQYEWSKPVTTNNVDIYWWIDRGGVGAPASYRMLYWNGSEFVPVSNAQGLGRHAKRFNTTTFDEVKTDKLRLEITSDGTHSTGILEWKVYSSGPVPLFPPAVDAGVDRAVVLGGKTYLSGKADWLVPTAAQRGSLDQDFWTGPCRLCGRRFRRHHGDLLDAGRVRARADGHRRERTIRHPS